MEVKINKEIRQYTESIFLGLSLRQFICSFTGCLVAIGLYFLLKPFLNTSILSWVCMAGVVPFVLVGFVKYNGMTAEKFFIAWVKSEILIPKRLLFKPSNFYLELYKLEDNKEIKKKNKKSKRFITKK